MSLKRIERWPNGDQYTAVKVFTCDQCQKEIVENAPHINLTDNQQLCMECGFKKGIVSEQEFLEDCGITLPKVQVGVRDDKIVVWTTDHAPWERDPQDLRRTAAYARWREEVFKRDNYTCRMCGQKGGNLNAHHIKHFAEYPNLRLTLSNGLTLCERCHRSIHKKKVINNGEGSIPNQQRNI